MTKGHSRLPRLHVLLLPSHKVVWTQVSVQATGTWQHCNETLVMDTQTGFDPRTNEACIRQPKLLLELTCFEEGCHPLQNARCVVWAYLAFKLSGSLQATPITLLCNIQSRSANQRKDSMSLHTQMK